MTSNKPYLVKAFYDWISDNDLTPYILVDANVPGVMVPQAFVKDGQIVLNISLGAVGSLALGDYLIEFSARFGGKLEQLTVPYGAVAAIYAKENGAGTSLPVEYPEEGEPDSSSEETSSKAEKQTSSLKSVDTKEPEQPTDKKGTAKTKPTLTIVKS